MASVRNCSPIFPLILLFRLKYELIVKARDYILIYALLIQLLGRRAIRKSSRVPRNRTKLLFNSPRYPFCCVHRFLRVVKRKAVERWSRKTSLGEDEEKSIMWFDVISLSDSLRMKEAFTEGEKKRRRMKLPKLSFCVFCCLPSSIPRIDINSKIKYLLWCLFKRS